MEMSKPTPLSILSWITCAAVIIAIADWPPTYYLFLRILILATCAWLVIAAKQKGEIIGIAIFVAIAILCNPFIPFNLSRAVWITIDVFLACAFGYGAIRYGGFPKKLSK